MPITTTLTIAVLVHRQFYSVTAATVAAVLEELELAERPEPSHLKSAAVTVQPYRLATSAHLCPWRPSR